jgi:dihydropteroate synthase
MNAAGNTRPLVMGIINVTPDSFSGDGILAHGDYVARATAQAAQMIANGADILDIGGESSRPGSKPVSIEEEIRRVVPVISSIKKLGATIAVDTVKAEVADQALLAGATILNDISALAAPHMAAVAAHHNATVVLMHNSSDASAVSHDTKIGGAFHSPVAADIIETVSRHLSARAEAALQAGIAPDKIILDPGIGFGKTVAQNLELIAHLDHLKILGFPLLMGVSRKSFIGHTLDLPVEERLEGTAACVTACILRGADIVRVHDVKFMARIVKMAVALRDA